MRTKSDNETLRSQLSNYRHQVEALQKANATDEINDGKMWKDKATRAETLLAETQELGITMRERLVSLEGVMQGADRHEALVKAEERCRDLQAQNQRLLEELRSANKKLEKTSGEVS